jgi:hypothetical protein
MSSFILIRSPWNGAEHVLDPTDKVLIPFKRGRKRRLRLTAASELASGDMCLRRGWPWRVIVGMRTTCGGAA